MDLPQISTKRINALEAFSYNASFFVTFCEPQLAEYRCLQTNHKNIDACPLTFAPPAAIQ